MKPKKVLTVGVLLVLAGALWYLGKSELPMQVVRGEKAATEGVPVAPTDAAPSSSTSESKPMKAAEAPAKNEGIPAWELKIDDALRSNADTAAIAQILLQQVPSIPGEGQLSSARHIVNLMPDKDYLSVLPYVRNTKLDPGFQEVIVAESLNRPDVVAALENRRKHCKSQNPRSRSCWMQILRMTGGSGKQRSRKRWRNRRRSSRFGVGRGARIRPGAQSQGGVRGARGFHRVQGEVVSYSPSLVPLPLKNPVRHSCRNAIHHPNQARLQRV